MADTAYTAVIPAYNAAPFLAETIDAVMAQSAPPSGIVVVDDGSTDATASVARQYGDRVRVISTSNYGQGHATTTGVKHVSTPVVAFCDADDVWLPDKVEKQLACLCDPVAAPDAVLTKMQAFGRTDLKRTTEPDSSWHRSTLLLWTAAFYRVGPICDMPNGYGEMIDWFARAQETGLVFSVLNEALVNRRIHVDSLSFTAGPGRDSDYLQTARRALMRKKLAGQ